MDGVDAQERIMKSMIARLNRKIFFFMFITLQSFSEIRKSGMDPVPAPMSWVPG